MRSIRLKMLSEILDLISKYIISRSTDLRIFAYKLPNMKLDFKTFNYIKKIYTVFASFAPNLWLWALARVSKNNLKGKQNITHKTI